MVNNCLRHESKRKRRRTFCMMFVCREFFLQRVSKHIWICFLIKMRSFNKYFSLTSGTESTAFYLKAGLRTRKTTICGRHHDRARSLIKFKLMATTRRQATHIVIFRWYSSLPIMIKINYLQKYERILFYYHPILVLKIWIWVYPWVKSNMSLVLLTVGYSVKHWNNHPIVSIDLLLLLKRIMFRQGYEITKRKCYWFGTMKYENNDVENQLNM